MPCPEGDNTAPTAVAVTIHSAHSAHGGMGWCQALAVSVVAHGISLAAAAVLLCGAPVADTLQSAFRPHRSLWLSQLLSLAAGGKEASYGSMHGGGGGGSSAGDNDGSIEQWTSLDGAVGSTAAVVAVAVLVLLGWHHRRWGGALGAHSRVGNGNPATAGISGCGSGNGGSSGDSGRGWWHRSQEGLRGGGWRRLKACACLTAVLQVGPPTLLSCYRPVLERHGG